MSVNSNVFQIRKNLGYSQDDIAIKMGITRQTYMKFENGTASLSTTQLEQLANIFGVHINEFYYEVQNTNKFKEMLVYILSKFGGKGLPKTKLAKLLYLTDFNHYYNNLESMSSVIYKCKDYGPLAEPFLEIVDEMIDGGEMHLDPLSEGAQMLTLSRSCDTKHLSLLSNEEKKEMDNICKKWSKSTTQEIVNFTHKQKPWMACRENEAIPYELILQEDPENVY